jgi:hypothetical protein
MLSGLYAKLIGIGLIVSACVGALLYVSHLQHAVKDLEQQLITCAAQGNVLSQKILDQNAAVDAAKVVADKRVAEAKVLIDAAKAETVKAKKKATMIYKTPPSTPGNSCKSALDLINGVQK